MSKLVKNIANWPEYFQIYKDKIIATYPSGDKHFLVEFISKGTVHDGSKFEWLVCSVFTIENGKIS
jgi:hypothetical protein